VVPAFILEIEGENFPALLDEFARDIPSIQPARHDLDNRGGSSSSVIQMDEPVDDYSRPFITKKEQFERI
jgi:hypothetical protein